MNVLLMQAVQKASVLAHRLTEKWKEEIGKERNSGA